MVYGDARRAAGRWRGYIGTGIYDDGRGDMRLGAPVGCGGDDQIGWPAILTDAKKDDNQLL